MCSGFPRRREQLFEVGGVGVTARAVPCHAALCRVVPLQHARASATQCACNVLQCACVCACNNRTRQKDTKCHDVVLAPSHWLRFSALYRNNLKTLLSFSPNFFFRKCCGFLLFACKLYRIKRYRLDCKRCGLAQTLRCAAVS